MGEIIDNVRRAAEGNPYSIDGHVHIDQNRIQQASKIQNQIYNKTSEIKYCPYCGTKV